MYLRRTGATIRSLCKRWFMSVMWVNTVSVVVDVKERLVVKLYVSDLGNKKL